MNNDRTPSLDENLSRLALLFAAECAVLRRLGAWIAGIPYWDAKLAVGVWVPITLKAQQCLLKAANRRVAATPAGGYS